MSSTPAVKQYKALGEEVWKSKVDKIVSYSSRTARVGFFLFIKLQNQQNAELFTLTYGSMVVQLVKDFEDYGEVNKQLEKM